jgi:hypothetical protein
MLSTLKPTDVIAAQQSAACNACHELPSPQLSERVRSVFQQIPPDMRDGSDISMAGADFSAVSLAGSSGASSSTYSEKLQLANTWFDDACRTQLDGANRSVGFGSDLHGTGETGCVDLMEHAVAIAQVLKIEMPGFMTALLRPGLADTAREFGRTVAQGLGNFVQVVEGKPADPRDPRKADFFAATTALRSDSPDLKGIWARNPMFAMNHLDDQTMLQAKVQQYTAKQQQAI